jgi:hypothetical protein
VYLICRFKRILGHKVEDAKEMKVLKNKTKHLPILEEAIWYAGQTLRKSNKGKTHWQ